MMKSALRPTVWAGRAGRSRDELANAVPLVKITKKSGLPAKTNTESSTKLGSNPANKAPGPGLGLGAETCHARCNGNKETAKDGGISDCGRALDLRGPGLPYHTQGIDIHTVLQLPMYHGGEEKRVYSICGVTKSSGHVMALLGA